MRLLFLFGTRPEAIKMAPVIKAASREKDITPTVCVTGQHRGMLDQVLDAFSINPDYDLNVMADGQSPSQVASRILEGFEKVIQSEKPDMVLVQGDTTSSMAGALVAFHERIQIGHVEAGLRTWCKNAPFPEEMNRVVISRLADIHFCPTEKCRVNLANEGINEENTFVTGNTVVDAINHVIALIEGNSRNYEEMFGYCDKSKRLVLVTCHRRESFGTDLENICEAIKTISVSCGSEVQIVYPVHLNPNVQQPVRRILDGLTNVHLVRPLDYVSFVYLMKRSHLILTDSGGVQEEAPSVGKPVLVMRKMTERTEGIEAGMTMLVGTTQRDIVEHTIRLLKDDTLYHQMNCSQGKNPYGDGKASERILDIISGRGASNYG